MNSTRGSRGTANTTVRMLPAMSVACVVGVLLVGHATNVRAVTGDIPATLSALSQITASAFQPRPAAEQERELNSYFRLLDQLGYQVVAEGAPEFPSWLHSRLVEIAVHRMQHRELHDELLGQYGSWHGDPQLQPRVLRPPELDPQHLTEGYRLAWEALLLAPQSAKTRFMQSRFTVTTALGRIGNGASIPVIVYVFGNTCDDEAVRSHNLTRRRLGLLSALGRMPSEESLEGILMCLARSDALAGEERLTGYTLREWTVRILSGENRLERSDRWQDILQSYSRVGVSRQDSELIDEARRRAETTADDR